MSDGKIQIKITKEHSGADVNLTALTLSSAEALTKILVSIREILGAHDTKDVRFAITDGCAEVRGHAPNAVIGKVASDLDQLLQGKLSKDKASPWRSLKKLVRANGLTYEAIIETDGKVRDVLSDLKGREERKKKIKPTPVSRIEFLKGKLLDVGGRKAKIHLLIGDQRQKIWCSESQVKSVVKFIYQDVKLSVWATYSAGNLDGMSLADLYIKDENFEKYKAIIGRYQQLGSVDRLETLHDAVEEFMLEKDFGRVVKLLRLFNSPIFDLSTLRTVLAITYGFKSHEKIVSVRNEIAKILEKKLSEVATTAKV